MIALKKMTSKYVRFAQGFIHEFPVNAAALFILPSARSSIKPEDIDNARKTLEYITNRDGGKKNQDYYISGGLIGTLLGGIASISYVTFAAMKCINDPDLAIKAGIVLTATNTASYLYERFIK